MDYELIFWCIMLVGALIGIVCVGLFTEKEYCVSDRTLKRIRGEWYK